MADCPHCHQSIAPRLLFPVDDLTPPVRTLVAAGHPGEQGVDRICPSCALAYAGRHAAQRSTTPLNSTTDPHTTLPYYHPLEESALAQAERLPDYFTLDGAGVTIAFLDSGYFPHPDLLADSIWQGPEPPWEMVDVHQWRNLLLNHDLRMVDYVDLTGGDVRRGAHQASLWGNSVDSWHGQMTTVIAAGNGLLSNGRYRGYAPGAHILPIKIGRGDGRIPEADILAGFQWLLHNENWQRYGVRVVNVSVGGDHLQPWWANEVCQAAQALTERGVLVAAAAGNSGHRGLLAPAQAPGVLTVGGFDDGNRRWLTPDFDQTPRLDLYPHNHDLIVTPEGAAVKPELLALGRYLPSPILPATPVFAETHAIGTLRNTLLDGCHDQVDRLLRHWHTAVHSDDGKALVGALAAGRRPRSVADSLPEIWQALRKRMNAHKWIHPYYQHVDGTSVAVAQVSAVAAQMFQANPNLTGEQVKALLLATALEMPQWPEERRGAGILQPVQAVAAALRSAGGLLGEYPRSGSALLPSRLHKWVIQGKVARDDVFDLAGGVGSYFYVGLYAPNAHDVSLIGTFNHWTPGRLLLRRMAQGWWHAVVALPAGTHHYRFWLESRDEPGGFWLHDPENPFRVESGFSTPHGVITVD